MTAEQIIPPITDPICRACWNQPHRRFIEMDDKSALMSEQTFRGLKEYSHSRPSGIYVGKMWKAQVRDKWFLRWYDGNPNHILIRQREILIL